MTMVIITEAGIEQAAQERLSILGWQTAAPLGTLASKVSSYY